MAPVPALLFDGLGPFGPPGRQTPPQFAWPLHPFCAPGQPPYGRQTRANVGQDSAFGALAGAAGGLRPPARCRAKPGSGLAAGPRPRCAAAPADRPNGRTAGGGGVLRVWGPVGPRPAKPTQGRGPKAPAPCVVRAVRARRPPFRQGFHQRQKGSVKARPRNLWGRANKPMVRKDVVTVPPPWAKPLPMPYGQRRLHPLRRGLPSQANRARCCATIAVRAGPRRARKIVHLTFFAASCTIGI